MLLSKCTCPICFRILQKAFLVKVKRVHQLNKVIKQVDKESAMAAVFCHGIFLKMFHDSIMRFCNYTKTA